MATATNFNSSAFTLGDPWTMHIQQTYGGRGINQVQPYWDMAGYKREMGAMRTASGTSAITGSGFTGIRGFGSSGTGSNPGGYNYQTLGNVAATTSGLLKTAANFAMDRMEGADPDMDFRFGNTPIYNQYRGKLQKGQQVQRVRALQQSRQIKQQQAARQQSINTFAGQAASTSQALAAGVTAANNPLKPGSSSPLPRGGVPQPGPVNLLTGPTALGQPPKKPRAARSTVRKPKATRSAPAVNLNDPSNW